MPTGGYPKVPAKAWQVLRARVVTAPSTKLTASYVAPLLNMSSPASAQTNVLLPLKKLGLLNEDGTLTERGARWRVDATYPQACDEIIKETYPEDLRALVEADGAVDRNQVTTWFHHQGFGGSNANSMAATFAMIAEKRLPEAGSAEPKKSASKELRKAPRAKATANASPAESPRNTSVEEPTIEARSRRNVRPDVHIDIQIHIPAEASAEQIDQIFASMSKHLYK